MSTLKVGGIRGVSASSDAITVANDGTATGKFTNPKANRRLNHNGDMRISQKGTSGTTSGTSGIFGPDRYNLVTNYAGFTISQDSDVPSGYGFDKSWKLQCTSTASAGSTGVQAFTYRMEGLDCLPFMYGTSSAKSATLQFWIKSNKTGQIQVNFENEANAHSGGVDGINTRLVSIASANTWQKVTVTMEGDTGVALDTDTNNKAFCFDVVLSAGTNYTSGYTQATTWSPLVVANQFGGASGFDIGDSTSNYVNITGVQLEIGDFATDFEFRDMATELTACQRYFTRLGEGRAFTFVGFGNLVSSTIARCYVALPTTMRAFPSVSEFGILKADTEMSASTNVTAVSDSSTTENGGKVQFTIDSHSQGQGQSIMIMTGDTSSGLDFKAEI
tara:strand:+ start:541 stop:1707 length:1167 start_codon:yes stop_codon:yes gene_type:complete